MNRNLGFIGVGTIAELMIDRLASSEGFQGKIYLSPRNKDKSNYLSRKYKNVTRCDSNQEVVNYSDVLMISVLPYQIEEIVKEIKIRKNQRIVSVVSDATIDDIRKWSGNVDYIARMVPLPFVRNGSGPIATYSENNDHIEIFDCLGEIIMVENENELRIMLAFTSLMGYYNEMLLDIVKWGVSKGLKEKASIEYVSELFKELSNDIINISESEKMTSGGLNEITADYLKSKKIASHFIDALDKVGKRLSI
jgi:pyrroline-5-carboxylate reductase